MSIWDLRQQVESAMPWWSPFAAAGVVLAFGWAIAAWQRRRARRWWFG